MPFLNKGSVATTMVIGYPVCASELDKPPFVIRLPTRAPLHRDQRLHSNGGASPVLVRTSVTGVHLNLTYLC